MCIASGLPVGLKAKDGKIYILIGKQLPPSPQPTAMHECVNAQLAPYAAKIVTITGTIVSKRGVNVIENAELLSQEALLQQSPDRLTDLKAHFTQFLQEQFASTIRDYGREDAIHPHKKGTNTSLPGNDGPPSPAQTDRRG